MPGGVLEAPLLAYLRRAYPMCPANVLRDAVKKKDCRVNGQRAGESARVRAGDRIRLYAPDEFLTGQVPILYEGSGLIACDKPAGLPVDRDDMGVGEDTIISRLRAVYPHCALCHRLDAGTSGVLLAATDEDTLLRVISAFRAREVEKNYVCRVVGRPDPPRGRMEDRLARRGSLTAVDRSGLFSSLDYAVRFTEGGESVVDIDLHTGRTHQIRVQFASRGWPLLGDDLYGDHAENRLRKARFIRLHCARVALLGREFLSTEPDWARKQ